MAQSIALTQERKWLVGSGVYAGLLVLAGALANLLMPYSVEAESRPPLLSVALWAALYIPLIVLTTAAGWKIVNFGFSVSPWMALAVLGAAALCGLSTTSLKVPLAGAFWEAFARTGEEVFFRGFLFLFFARLFQSRRRPWLWAVFFSALVFALVHTQSLQSDFATRFGSPFASPAWMIFNRFLNVFLFGCAFALLRQGTRSILPGAILHSLLNGGLLALPFVILIYLVFTGWAKLRGERVTFGFNAEVV